MDCPNKHGSLEKAMFHHVEVDYCPQCFGMWFEKDELMFAKNDKDRQLNWLDFDVWRDRHKFSLTSIEKRCPACRIPFVQIGYDDSHVTIDFCKHCQGIWLDHGEFKQIISYLKRKSDYEVLHHYMKNLVVQLWEVFAGPKRLRQEVEDVLMLVKLFNYKFMTQHPHIEALIETLPK